jgi:hypothetical protein
MSAAAKFQEHLGAEVAELLGSRCRFFKSRKEIRAEAPNGHNVIIISGSNKYSPLIDVAFYFGKNFAAAKEVERRLGLNQFYYHIQQYSYNRAAFQGLPFSGPCTWEVDISNPPPRLANQVVEAINGLAVPFFDRFETIRAARDAIAEDDPWCFGGRSFWRQLLRLDFAMDDLAHFQGWSTCLDDFNRKQAEAEIARLFRRTGGDA